jgi:nucleoid-associated protein YgaU
LPWIVAVGAITFAIGISGTLYVTQSQQATQAEALSAIVAQLSDIQVSRAQTPDLLGIAAPITAVIEDEEIAPELPVVTPVSATPAMPATIPSATSALAAAPLTEEQQRSKEDLIAEAIAISNRNQLRMLTEGVVAGLYSVTTEDTDGTGSRIALQPRNAATTAEALEGILAAAAESGEIELPEASSTSDGNVDPQTLLFDLVQRSLENGSVEEVEAARELQLRAFAASTAETETIGGERFYTVESGDSLAYIALQFYGSTSAYGPIFEANRDLLSSPDKVQIGQRLRIPNA